MQIEGLVLKNYSGFYYVQDKELNIYECKVRGKVKEKILSGDRVLFTILQKDKGILEKRLPRSNQLYRPKVANVNLVLIVMAFDRPRPVSMLLDRLLFHARFNNLEPYIILNKCDLEADETASRIREYYPQAGFNYLETSTKQNIGIEELRQIVNEEIAVFAGPSGAGKSSLLRKLKPDIDVATQEVSNKIGRGKHTTRHSQLYPLESGGCIVDTPGFSMLDMPSIKREEMPEYFPDFDQFTDNCRFYNCLHYKESECGVKQAVEEGLIPQSRYQNYIAMLEEVIEKERCY